MWHRYAAWFLATTCLLGITLSPGDAQSRHELRTRVEWRGSVPPIPDWFTCVRELDQKAYDKVQAQACLRSILSHSEIVKGRVSFHRYKVRDVLSFRVESPSLVVTDIDWDVPPGDIAPLQDFLAIDSNALHTGAVYTVLGEASTVGLLEMLLRNQGQRGGISRTVRLDYGQKAAHVAFKIWEGPPGISAPLVPPYAQPCAVLNANFNWMDTDDFSPVRFVERQMKAKWQGCFSETDVRDDSAMLKRMKFLTESNISVEGSGGQRSISVHLRSHPIPIASVTVKGYGLLEGQAMGEAPPLAIHEGDSYSRTDSYDSAHLLKKAFMKVGRQVSVFTDVEITAGGKADLQFSVLAYPDDVVYVNGASFDGSFPDQADLNPD